MLRYVTVLSSHTDENNVSGKNMPRPINKTLPPSCLYARIGCLGTTASSAKHTPPPLLLRPCVKNSSLGGGQSAVLEKVSANKYGKNFNSLSPVTVQLFTGRNFSKLNGVIDA